MALHKDLTGAELHEPKGAATAADGSVYVANGSGSGVWTPRFSGAFVMNQYWMQGEILDISTVNSRAYFYVPVNSEVIELAAVLNGPISVANDVLSVYINGILFADTLTVNFAGSFAGQLHQVDFTTANTIAGGSVIEVRSNGASDTVAAATVVVGLRAKV